MNHLPEDGEEPETNDDSTYFDRSLRSVLYEFKERIETLEEEIEILKLKFEMQNPEDGIQI